MGRIPTPTRPGDLPLTHDPQPPGDTRFERWTVLLGILLLAFNLRPAAVSVGPVLAETVAELGMGEVSAGVLTALVAILTDRNFTSWVGLGWFAVTAAVLVALSFKRGGKS